MAPSVQLHLGNCHDWVLPEAPDIVITNPPWGRRLGGPQDYFGSEDEEPEEEAKAEEAWADLRQFLKGQCPGAPLNTTRIGLLMAEGLPLGL